MHRLSKLFCLVLACGFIAAGTQASEATGTHADVSYENVAAGLDVALRRANLPERLAAAHDVLLDIGYDLTLVIADDASEAAGVQPAMAAEPQVLPLDFVAAAPAYPQSKAMQSVLRLAQPGQPRIIVLSQGSYSLSGVADALAKQGNAGMIASRGGATIVNLPIYVGPGAALTISARDADSITLNVASGAFIVAAGDVTIDSVKISGSEGEVRRRPDDEPAFNSFVLIGGGGTLRASNAHFTHLGSPALQAFGIGLVNASADSRITTSRFDKTYGLRIEETRGAAITGNEFAWLPGPAIHVLHSSNARIGGNLIYGSAGSAGIVLGQGAYQAKVSGNVLLRNRSGIAVVMDSGGNVISANAVIASDGPGISLSGRNCILVRGNDLLANRGAGIAWRGGPARLISNHIAFNQQAGVMSPGEASAVPAAPGALALTGNRFEYNRIGLRIDVAAAITLENNSFSHQSPRLIAGRLGRQIGAIMAAGAAPIHLTSNGQAAFTPTRGVASPGCSQDSASMETN